VGGVTHPLDAAVVAVPDDDGPVFGRDQDVPVPVLGVVLVQYQVHVVGTLVAGYSHHILDFVGSRLHFLELLFRFDVYSELADFEWVGDDFVGIVVETAPLLDELVVLEVVELDTVVARSDEELAVVVGVEGDGCCLNFLLFRGLAENLRTLGVNVAQLHVGLPEHAHT